MKPKYFLFLLLSFYILNSTSSIATVRYVSKSGTSTPPYTSWQTAADSIQKCINICVDGDTVYVGNGVYIEQIVINKSISLVGLSMDSTIIDGRNAIPYRIVFFSNYGSIENFTINGAGSAANVGIGTFNANIHIKNCKVKNIAYGMTITLSTSIVENCFITNCSELYIRDECGEDTCQSIYRNNIIISTMGNTGAYFSFGGKPTFINNLVIDEASRLRGVDIQYNSGAIIKNNLVSGYSGINIRAGVITSDTAYIENNISVNSLTAYDASTGDRTIIRNNIAKDSFRGIQSSNGTLVPNYNLFWNLDQLYYGTIIPGDSNTFADPMFIKDTIPIIGGAYDFHLQKYSPAIDKGDPNILDKDGTRSDIGMYGGPLGETYTYQDLAPLAPRNFSAVLDSEYIRLKWNKNTEADTSFYKVYRDTVTGFQIDSTKLIASVADTFFVQTIPHKKSKVVYKITCVDNQGNESLPSVEVVVDLTSVSADDYPMTISDYILYQNYPNPFNPSTRIGYQLKERAYVKLMVYDIKGELISVLVNKEQNAGYYEVEFSSSSIQHPVSSIQNLASGIYLYRIEVIGEGNIPVYTEMKKMLMIK